MAVAASVIYAGYLVYTDTQLANDTAAALETTRADLVALERQNAELRAQSEAAISNAVASDDMVAALQAELEEARARLAEAEKTAEQNVSEDLVALEARADSLSAQATQLRGQLEYANQQIAQCVSSLNNATAAFNAYSLQVMNGVRAATAAAPECRSIMPVLNELLVPRTGAPFAPQLPIPQQNTSRD